MGHQQKPVAEHAVGDGATLLCNTLARWQRLGSVGGIVSSTPLFPTAWQAERSQSLHMVKLQRASTKCHGLMA